MSSSQAVASGGNSNVAERVEVMELTSASQAEYMQHQQLQLDLEAKKRAFEIDVPTLVNDVRSALRQLGLPVRLFGENLANVRDRLRLELARREVQNERGIGGGGGDGDFPIIKQESDQKQEQDEEEITKYSRAAPELIRAREQFALYSLEQSRHRLDRERNYRLQWQRKRSRFVSSTSSSNPEEDTKKDAEEEEEYADVTRIDEMCIQTYKWLRSTGLEGSQYGDGRPLSAMCTSRSSQALPIIATGSWSATIKLWDGSSPELQLLSEKTMAHEDRIMGIAMKPQQEHHSHACQHHLLATASIDTTAKLWKVTSINDDHQEQSSSLADTEMATDDVDDRQSSSPALNIEEVAHLKGHARRLCKVAFHPQGRHVATTSFDHTWRLWDCETGGEVLLQDGHWKEVYGVGFHPDGSICSTTDYGSVVQLWDLRTGKSIHHFLGHARRVLCSEFSSNGFQLATAGDDGMIKVWDLRKRKQFVSIPAHSNLITQLRFDCGDGSSSTGGTDDSPSSSALLSGGEYLVSSSFDGTAKVWSARDWKLLSTLRGHEGKVMAVDVLPQQKSLVTCGFDKTLKLWR